MHHGRPPYPHVHQVSVSDGGVPKRPVFEAKVSKDGVEGDRQENLKFHGGPDRAVCLYSLELIERLQDEGHSIDAGLSGENLTIAGLEWDRMQPGVAEFAGQLQRLVAGAVGGRAQGAGFAGGHPQDAHAGESIDGSEERRVGKECRSRWSPYH